MSDDASMQTPLDDHRLICPHEGGPLARADRVLSCPAGHCFDIAKQGHVNLLPVAHKASRHPGDSTSMVQARARVMDTGLFAVVGEAVCSEVLASPGGRLLDVGCGDGWFTAQVAAGAPEVKVLALDISKQAVLAAARRRAGFACVVASGKALPIAPGEADTLLCLFGFPFWAHWSDRQTAGQRVITVDPGPDHLLELRERIYADVRRHDAPSHDAARAVGYRCVQRRTLRARGVVSDWVDLLEMTPHGRRCSAAARETLQATASSEVSIDVVLQVFERQARQI